MKGKCGDCPAFHDGNTMRPDFFSQCTPEAQAERKAWVQRTHPIHAHKDEEPAPKPIPATEAIAMLREAEECYEGRLKEIRTEIAILGDCL